MSNTPGNTGIIFSTWKSTGNLQSLLEISGLVSEFVRLSLILVTILVFQSVSVQTRMWANAKRDGCPAEYRWHIVFHAAKFGRRPLLECCAVTLPRRETH